MKNNNGASIRKLSRRSLKNNRMRNLFAILAIALTGTLFTASFTLTSGITQSFQETTMREVGTKSHAGLKAVTNEQYEAIIADPMIKDSCYNILIGVSDNIRKRSANLRYIPDEKALDDWFITLEEGRLPVEKDEIIVDTFIMDELEIPCETGQKVPMKFQFMGQEIEEEFTVSGWYQGDYIAHASELFLSESYWNNLKGSLSDDDFVTWKEEHPEDNGAGLMSVNLLFDNSSNIQEKVQTVIQNAGYEAGEEIEYGVNWAYMNSRLASVDPMTLFLLSTVILIIVLTGYLIIYNIFQISVIGDIRFYGLLKTIGTTRKQLRRLIMRQAFILSVIGIPLGLLAGFGIGNAILPFAFHSFTYNDLDVFIVYDPWVFVFGAVFSALTVFLSCRKPGKIAGRVSPIEAVKYTDTAVKTSKKKKKSKHSKRFHPLSMAFANLCRSKRTTAVVISAITLSITLLALIVTAVNSFRLDEFIAERIIGDFLIGHTNITTTPRTGDLNIDPELIALADSQQGITSKYEMWTQYGCFLQVDQKALEQYHKLSEEGKLSPNNLEKLLNGEKSIDGYTYAYDKELLSHLNVIEGTLDIEKFLNGGYILLGTLNGNDGMQKEDHVYRPGDQVVLEYVSDDSTFREIKDESGQTIDIAYENLATKEYEVMAIVDIPYSMNVHRYAPNACDIVLPLPLADLPSEHRQCFAISYQVEDEYQAAFEKAIQNYTKNVSLQMGYLSRTSLENEFHSMTTTISIIGITLSAVIALIGILNFINTMITQMVSRKREFAMLQSIGMTNTQLRKVLVYEGICYIAISGAISFIFGSFFSWLILRALNQLLSFFDYHFQILPFLIMMPLLILVAILAPLLSYKNMRKKSIVERLRETE